MNRQQALSVLGIQGPDCDRQKVERAFQSKLQALADNKPSGRHTPGQRDSVARRINLARSILLNANQSKPLSVTQKRDIAMVCATSFRPAEPTSEVQGQVAPVRPMPKAEAGYGSREERRGSNSVKNGRSRRSSNRRRTTQRPITQIPKVLVDRFELHEQIGRGGMGVIFKAFDRVRQEFVAIKILSTRLSEDSEAHERFAVEAKLASKLAHPNIVRVFDLQQHQDITFLSMELLAGCDLRRESQLRMERGSSFSVKEVLNWSAQLCSALAYAHDHTVHRDIKPENVWLCKDGTLKLMDFGIAAVPRATHITGPGVALGTAGYMAPEQAQGQTVDARADQYSLAVLLFELLTGDMPQGTTRKVYELRPAVSRPLSQAIMKGLSADPQNRYADISAFARGLKRKSLAKIPMRAVVPFIALLVGLLVSSPFWPRLTKRTAVHAQQRYLELLEQQEPEPAVDAVQTLIKAINRDRHAGSKKLTMEHTKLPTIPYAKFYAETAEALFKDSKFLAAKEKYEKATDLLVQTADLRSRFVGAAEDEHLSDYLAASQKSSDDLPRNLQQDIADVAELLEAAKTTLDENDFPVATQQYERALELLEATVEDAASIAPHLEAWKSVQQAMSELVGTESRWANLKQQIDEAIDGELIPPMDSDVQSRIFSYAADAYRLRSVRADTHYSAEARSWARLAEQYARLTQEYSTSLEAAGQWLKIMVLTPEEKTTREAAEKLQAAMKLLNETANTYLQLEYTPAAVGALELWLRDVALEAIQALNDDMLPRIDYYLAANQPFEALRWMRETRYMLAEVQTTADKFSRQLEEHGIEVGTGGGTSALAAIPDVAGMDVDEAIEKLQEEGFRMAPLSMTEQARSHALVFGTNPETGARIDAASITVELDLVVPIDDVVGLAYRGAVATLHDRGLVPFTNSDVSPAALVSEVIADDSPRDGFARVGSRVELREGIQIPDLVDFEVKKAIKILSAIGLRPEISDRVVTRKTSPSRGREGLFVGYMQPSERTMVNRGASVVITQYKYAVAAQEEQRTSVRERTVPNAPLPPAIVYFENNYNQDLIVQLYSSADRQLKELLLNKNSLVAHRIRRDPGSTLVRELVNEKGQVVRELSRKSIPGKSLYAAAVSEYAVQSVYIDATGKDKQVPPELRPAPYSMGTKSIGVFSLPGGAQLANGDRIDAYAAARRASNSGLAVHFPKPESLN